MPQIYVTDTDRGGQRQTKYIPAGGTVRNYFEAEKGGQKMDQYVVTVNRAPAGPDTVIPDGANLVISAAKPVGAGSVKSPLSYFCVSKNKVGNHSTYYNCR